MSRVPAQVTFRGIRPIDAVECDIREHVAWLEQFYPRIVGIRTLVEVPHRHRRHGRHVHVRVELTVPGGPRIVVSHEPSRHASLRDVEGEHSKETEIHAVHRFARTAVHDAFDAARRRLQDFAREQRGEVKAHDVVSPGTV